MNRKTALKKNILIFSTGLLLVFVGFILTILIWDPEGKVQKIEADNKWLNSRTEGAINLVNSQLVKINELNSQTNKITGYLTDEVNEPNPDKAIMKKYADDAKANLQEFADLSDETCTKFKQYIDSDPHDLEQRGQDKERFCLVLNGYKSAALLRVKGIDALLKLDVKGYGDFMDQSDELLFSTNKAIAEFESTPLKAP